jgi:hypothetical protein
MSKFTPLTSLQVVFLTLEMFFAAFAPLNGVVDETFTAAPLTRLLLAAAPLRENNSCTSCRWHNAARPRLPVFRNRDV